MSKKYTNHPMHKINNIHFIGIAGVGMSGIAEVLLNDGYHVSGSDLQTNATTEHLTRLNATIYVGHHSENVENADVVVISSAIDEHNPELQAARQRRIPVISRAEMLGELMRFRYGIAVAGTHGKTTTTSLVASLLAEGGLDPTFVIGGRLNSAGSNARLGLGEILVAEADESDASFLALHPMMAIITNIDRDHLNNYYNDFQRVKDTFVKFIHHLPFYGLAIVCIDNAEVRDLLPKIQRRCITYGFSEEADLQIIDFSQKGTLSQFTVLFKARQTTAEFTLNLPGKHNVSNAVAAIAIALEHNVKLDNIRKALLEFQGIGRRFQLTPGVKIPQGEVTLIDDYGHHPKEIECTLQAIRQGWPDRRLVLVFQPHRYSRTQDLFDDFAHVLSGPDVLIMTEVYAAGESPIRGAESRDLCRSIRSRGQLEPILVSSMDQFINTVLPILQHDDLLLMQGAGNIGQMAAKIARAQSLQE